MRMMIIGMLVLFASLLAQAPPGQDIYLVSISMENDSMVFGTPKNITQRPGYDNQPSFTPDGKQILYTSIREDGQADIFVYDIETAQTRHLINTPESEFSPTIMPGSKGISVVRVEADSTQRLWQFDREGKNPALLLSDVRKVGYHAWGNEDALLLFVVGEPHQLHYASVKENKSTVVFDKIGRSVLKVPVQDAFSFTHLEGENDWWVKEIDMTTRRIRPLIKVVEGSQDCAWTANGMLLMASGSTIYGWQYGEKEEWQQLVTFDNAALNGIGRMAVDPQMAYIALVVSEPETEESE